VPHGTPKEVAKIIKTFVDAGLRVPKILDYGAMAGLKYAASSAANVRAAEDELIQLCDDLR
jgi:phthiodiolone/phenolphthiodiolone dimycocerosates ketoreductase